MMRSRIRVDPVFPENSTPSSSGAWRSRSTPSSSSSATTTRAVAAAVANRLANDFIDEHIKERVQASGDTADFVESELQRLSSRLREVEAQIAQVKRQQRREPARRRRRRTSARSRAAFDRLSLARSGSPRRRATRPSTRSRPPSRGNPGSAAAAPELRAVLSPNQRLQVAREPARRAAGPRLHRQAPRRGRDARRDGAGARSHRSAATTRTRTRRPPPSPSSRRATRRSAPRCASRARRRKSSGCRGEIDRAQRASPTRPASPSSSTRSSASTSTCPRATNEFSNKRLDAAVAANMERRQKGEQFRVLEPAYPPPDPTSPNRPLILALGLMLGLGAGARSRAAARRRRLLVSRRARSSRRRCAFPVLASIPAMLLDADRSGAGGATCATRSRPMLVGGASCVAASLVGYVVREQAARLPGGGAGGARGERARSGRRRRRPPLRRAAGRPQRAPRRRRGRLRRGVTPCTCSTSA